METPEGFAATPSAFERLWTPHRMVYVGGEKKPGAGGKKECPFCLPPEQGSDFDERKLIVARGEHCFAILNLYPYNPGHLLICPYRHLPQYPELTGEERIEFGEFTARAMRALRKVSGAAGFNIGMNQGEVGGAGIAAHLHQHVVPRWMGDSNFMPIIAQTKAMPQLLGQTHTMLREAWESA